MRYYIYTRCSTEEQRKQGNSHQYQIAGIKSHPRVANDTLLDVFSDTITGTTFDRPELDKLYHYCDIHRGHVDYILVYRWDRFGRDVGEAFQMIKQFKSVGVTVNCLDSSIDYTDDNWPTILAVIFGMAQSESLKIQSRTKDGMYQSNVNGYYSKRVPVGYRRKDSDIKKTDGKMRRIVVVDDAVAPIIRKIFDGYIHGQSKADLLYKYGPDLPCARSGFYRIFDTFLYTGYIDLPAYKHYPARVVKGKHEAIISMDTWRRAQAVSRRSTQGMKYNVQSSSLYMHGVIRHEHQLYTSYYSRGKLGQRYGYYDIRGKKGMILSSTKCHEAMHHLISQLHLDLSADHIAIIRDLWTGMTADMSAQLTQCRRQLTMCDKRIEKIQNDYYDDHLDARSYNSMYDKVDLQREELKREIHTLEHELIEQDRIIERIANTVANLSTIFFKSNADGRLAFLKALFPSGFDIVKPKYTVRTQELNSVVTILCSNSAFYDQIENTNGTPFSRDPALGPLQDKFRTHLLLLTKVCA